MKKATILIAAILIAMAVSGQVKGVDLDNVAEVKSDEELSDHIEDWVFVPEQDVYIFTIRMAAPKAVDYKHLITELDDILEANDLDINKPDDEDDLLPSGVSGLRDYSNLAYYVSLGEAEIIRGYYLDDGWIIKLVCSYDLQALLLIKVQE